MAAANLFVFFLSCAGLLSHGTLGFFTGFGDGSSTATVYDYLGVNSMLPFYMAMFKEMNNFDRSGGNGGIGLGTGLLNADGSVTYPDAAASSSGSGSYGGGSSNGGYSSGSSGNSDSGYSGRSGPVPNRNGNGNMNMNMNMNRNMNRGGMGGFSNGGSFGFGGGSSGGFGGGFGGRRR